jgi:4,5-DOPA dioxygenase extradiol
MSRLPALFISHGAPNLVLYDSPARDFLASLGQEYERPKAILVASAHWETPLASLNGAAQPDTIHDFYGFEPELYQQRYNAPGTPPLAERAAQLLHDSGIEARVDPRRGRDHGAWSPLQIMYPAADIPLIQVSLLAGGNTRQHYELGQALRPLRDEGVLLIGSGSATHNLREMRPREDDHMPEWAASFADWLRDAVSRGDRDSLLDYRAQAPHAARNHPSEEHYMPLPFALGASTPGTVGRLLHSSVSYGVLAMDAYAFD